MKNYEEMSDFEVNCLVACQFNGHSGQVSHMENGVKALDSTGIFYSECDYCNDPSDAWPIIVDNQISVNNYDNEKIWFADVQHPVDHPDFNTIEVGDKNPLRAAMICFLKMKDAENV